MAVVSLVVGSGCAPSLRDRHPDAFERLVAVAPECEDPAIERWEACDTAAQILEVQPQRATTVFMAHWERSAFGDIEASRQTARATGDLVGMVVATSDKNDAIAAIQEITAPALFAAYRRSKSPYARSMLPHVNLIVATSPSSLGSFRLAHVAALAEKAPVAVAAKKPAGVACSSSAQCTSDLCMSGKCADKPKVASGAACGASSECASDLCIGGTCADAPTDTVANDGS